MPRETSFTVRRRTYVACTHCRRRKIKCITDDLRLRKPCERCGRKGLQCRYLAVAEEQIPPCPRAPGRNPIYGEASTLGGPLSSRSNTHNDPSRHNLVHPWPISQPSTDRGCNLSSCLQYPSPAPRYSSTEAALNYHPGSAAGYHVDYNQIFPDSGLNNVAPNTYDRRCICPPGPCYCGGTR
ncbi:hypothetical protein B0H15DRAFT_386469 [Mycena belliarum]|uniref:Zn(2)-C6 fungal-type domain-containing protein n=1 Tax=Mycena belliarum TaxID=1033014 RepID=A0AAD6XKE0_9AGAR|nr:hypothetical protein B0H15DRAFT_386469 [Mycena belliae]